MRHFGDFLCKKIVKIMVLETAEGLEIRWVFICAKKFLLQNKE